MLAVGGFLATALFSEVKAQETNTYRTNVLINITFNLTSYEQVYLITDVLVPSAKTSKVATSGIIRTIAQHARITGDMSNTKLYYRLSWSDPTNVSSDMILRNPGGHIMGTNDAVVNSWISLSFPDTVTSVQAAVDGTTNATDYANLSATLNNTSPDGTFTLHGIATIKSGSLFYNGKVIDRYPNPKSFISTVTGSGNIGYYPYRQLEWKGTVTGSGQKVEVTQVSP